MSPGHFLLQMGAGSQLLRAAWPSRGGGTTELSFTTLTSPGMRELGGVGVSGWLFGRRGYHHLCISEQETQPACPVLWLPQNGANDR